MSGASVVADKKLADLTPQEIASLEDLYVPHAVTGFT